jgi:hypothetical protein
MRFHMSPEGMQATSNNAECLRVDLEGDVAVLVGAIDRAGLACVGRPIAEALADLNAGVGRVTLSILSRLGQTAEGAIKVAGIHVAGDRQMADNPHAVQDSPRLGHVGRGLREAGARAP